MNGARRLGAALPAAELVECPPGWRARLYRQLPFPLTDPLRTGLAAQIVTLAESLMASGMHGQTFLQSWKLSAETGNNIVSEHQPAWKLQRGLGVWLGKEAPAGWTEEGLMNAAAAAFQGEEPRVPLHYVLQLSTAPQAFTDMLALMTGRGVAVTFFTLGDPGETLEQNRAFLAGQVSGRFKRSSLFLPLLDASALGANAPLDDWFRDIRVYVRESAEDRGILILHREEDDALFAGLENRQGVPIGTQSI